MGSRRFSAIVLALVLLLLAGSAWAISSKPTVLGLDLQGGTELVYEAIPTPKNPEIDEDDMERAIEIVRDRVDAFGVAEPEIAQVGGTQISVALPNVDNADDAIAQVGDTAQLYFYDFEGGPEEDVPNVVPRDRDVQNPGSRPYMRLWDAVQAASKRKPECYQDLCTTNGPTFYLFDRQTLELLAGPTERREDLFLEWDGEQPERSVVKEVPQGTVVVRAEPSEDDPETEDVDESESARGWFVLRDRPELSGDEIRNPEQNYDQFNQPIVTFEFTDEGRRAFEEVTRRIALRGLSQAPDPTLCSSRPDLAPQYSGTFAVVLDGEIQSRPIIDFCENPRGIDGRTGAQISGLGSLKEAQDLATVLRIGALPVKLQLISESQVSATLGQQALDEGLVAGLVGLVLVLLFLIVYYRFLGVVAGLGLLVYALYFLALIKVIPITMTLPGIAGTILTIGVAADSNIVIFERIKEEVRKGRSLLSAISVGYRRGIATIIDANVIILITSFILFVLATAGVKGFAFTLGIGTIVALFTAVLFTQAILAVLGRSKFLRSPRFLGASEEQRVRWNFDFTGASKWFFTMSGVILVIGAVAFATKQFNLGIDFESGSRITAGLAEEATVEEVRDALIDAGIPGIDSAKIQLLEGDDLGETGVQIQAPLDPDQAAEVRPALEEAFGLAGAEGGEEAYESTTVGPTFGEQIARSAAWAIGFALLVICIYVAIRFEAKYAVPVLIALIHDILLTMGVYALVDREVTSATVAALLTILGLSMYDTIIVFDRIRENVPRMPRAAFSQIVNRSMSEILTRTIITGLSTVFVLASLLVFGGETLRDFAFAMMIGTASGFYSSIFIATPVLTHWKEREHTYRVRRAQIEEAMGYVPVFPEDNVVAKVDDEGASAGRGAAAVEGSGDAAAASEAAPATGATAVGVVERAERPDGGRGESDDARDEGAKPADGLSPASRAAAERAARRRAQQRKRRRKHGRPR
ncbi:MAG TPA: protein translocase subunit SecD [Solirubrobacterales bacterium]